MKKDPAVGEGDKALRVLFIGQMSKAEAQRHLGAHHAFWIADFFLRAADDPKPDFFPLLHDAGLDAPVSVASAKSDIGAGKALGVGDHGDLLLASIPSSARAAVFDEP